MALCFAAVDLGATSGRVILGRLADGRFLLEECHRFVHDPLATGTTLRWDADRIFGEVRAGLAEAERRAAAEGGLVGIGVDTWGVDYGLVDADGRLVVQPYHYRDSRTDGVPERLGIDASALYGRCGLQVQPFNTIYQLVAHAGAPEWVDARTLLLMPDLISHHLTGRRVAEVTMASTTGLLDARTRDWSTRTIANLTGLYGLPLDLVLPDLVEPGTILGPVDRSVVDSGAQVVAVGGHDTASAIVAVPATDSDFAYISSGTWSLVGLELDHPVLTEASAQANFTNELGVDGTVRYLKNVMGLWVLTESIHEWTRQGLDVRLVDLLAEASGLPPLVTVVDMADQRLIPPGDMPGRLAAMAAETGQPVPRTPGEFTRCILDSLALAYRTAIREACSLAGRTVDVVHVVGGGSQNTLLCRLTAEATRLPVVAGPAEGTALGNLLVQARALKALTGGLADLRGVAAASSSLVRYAPGDLGLSQSLWDAAALRLARPRPVDAV